MHMIPDAAPPAQPTDLYRVDITNSATGIDSVIFDSTEDEASASALGIVTALGGDSGDIYQHNGAGQSTYYDTVVVE